MAGYDTLDDIVNAIDGEPFASCFRRWVPSTIARCRMTDFTLHPRLAADTLPVGDLPLCRVLLMDDARFPWLILVPRRFGLVEVIDLGVEDRAVLIEEIALASRALRAETGADKLNIGALGNLVAQLHVHVVARSAADAAWPGPVWGSGAADPYPGGAARALAGRLAPALGFR